MKQMWSPWRSQHIVELHDKKEDRRSLFMRLAAEDDDERNMVVYRGENLYVVMNRFPYNNGHLLIVPYRQVESFDELNEAEQVETARLISLCIGWLRKAVNAEGFNVGMNLGEAAGAGVPEHLHVHVVPRWSGDTNFMPTVGDIKVVPEAMHDTYRKLKEAVSSLEK